MDSVKTLLLLVSVTCFGQSLPFEVASIKVHQGPGRIGIAISGPRFTAEAELLTNLISWAYDLKHYQIPQTPALAKFGDTFYDVSAKAEGESTPAPAAFREMLRHLLEDRFHLVTRREVREAPVYALVVARNGPKLKESTPDADAIPKYSSSGRNDDVTMAGGSIENLIRIIENSLIDRPVVDQTGLRGVYNIHLIYTPNTRQNQRSPDPDDISIFTAVRSLGLRLQPQKASMEMLIVDHAEKPSAN
jgi:uncharacterized protein (TIGR03435 family)